MKKHILAIASILALAGCAEDPLEAVRGSYYGAIEVTVCPPGSTMGCGTEAQAAHFELTDSPVRLDGAEVTFGGCYVHFDIGRVYNENTVDLVNAGGMCGTMLVLGGTGETAIRELSLDLYGIVPSSDGLLEAHLYGDARR